MDITCTPPPTPFTQETEWALGGIYGMGICFHPNPTIDDREKTTRPPEEVTDYPPPGSQPSWPDQTYS